MKKKKNTSQHVLTWPPRIKENGKNHNAQGLIILKKPSQPSLTRPTCDLKYETWITSLKEKQNKSWNSRLSHCQMMQMKKTITKNLKKDWT